MHANFFFAEMMQKAFLITCMQMKFDLEVIISVQITYNFNELICPKFSGSIINLMEA